MLNPFILDPKRKREKDSRIINEERNAQDHGYIVRRSAVRNQLSLRLGMLLIRMGKELAGEGTIQESSEEP